MTIPRLLSALNGFSPEERVWYRKMHADGASGTCCSTTSHGGKDALRELAGALDDEIEAGTPKGH